MVLGQCREGDTGQQSVAWLVSHSLGRREDPRQGGLGSQLLGGHGECVQPGTEGDNQVKTDLPQGHSSTCMMNL